MKKLIIISIIFNTLICAAQSVTNGSVTGAASNSGINGGNATGWSGCNYSPDVCNVSLPSYVASSQVTPSSSPDGGTWLGLAAMSPAGTAECAQTSITGLTIGQSYVLYFYAACFGTGTSICNNSPATPTITIGASSQMYTIPMVASTWVLCTMPFTATAATMTLEAKHTSTFGSYYAYVGLDGFTLNVPLPTELTSFKAKKTANNDVKLDWQTATEINNDYFTIERSVDGINWEVVEIRNGAGNSTAILNYEALDESPYRNTSYYRLKQTDFDGKYSYSQTESINLLENQLESNVEIYPNPTNGLITIEGNSFELEDIKIYNYLGQNVTCHSMITENHEEKVVIDLYNLSKGIYYLKTRTMTNKVHKL